MATKLTGKMKNKRHLSSLNSVDQLKQRWTDDGPKVIYTTRPFGFFSRFSKSEILWFGQDSFEFLEIHLLMLLTFHFRLFWDSLKFLQILQDSLEILPEFFISLGSFHDDSTKIYLQSSQTSFQFWAIFLLQLWDPLRILLGSLGL